MYSINHLQGTYKTRVCKLHTFVSGSKGKHIYMYTEAKYMYMYVYMCLYTDKRVHTRRQNAFTQVGTRFLYRGIAFDVTIEIRPFISG